MVEVELLDPDAPLENLPAMVNAAFAEGEAGMWEAALETDRVTPYDLRKLVDAGELVVARSDGALVGCMRLCRLDAATAELGLLTAAREAVGAGIGRAMVAFAEAWAREQGLMTMHLTLLVPRGPAHPFKVRLDGWYTRMGYRVVGRTDFADDYPQAAAKLTTPCDLVHYEKSL